VLCGVHDFLAVESLGPNTELLKLFDLAWWCKTVPPPTNSFYVCEKFWLLAFSNDYDLDGFLVWEDSDGDDMSLLYCLSSSCWRIGLVTEI